MIILSQRDSRWGDEKLGTTSYKINRWGCTLTCISMLSDYFATFKGVFKTPKILAKQVAFTKDGLILWDSLKTCTQMKLDQRVFNRDDGLAEKYLKDPEKAVLFQVRGNHWVLGLAKIGGVFKVADPWFGDKCFTGTTLTRYPKITGMALISLN